MHRHWLPRSLSALFALWFVVSIGEPSVARICPEHSSAAALLASGHGSPQGAGSAHAHHGATGNHHSPGSQHHHCNCINCCVGSTAAVLVSPAVAIAATELVVAPAQVFASVDARVRSNPLHRLPPGRGPPRA